MSEAQGWLLRRCLTQVNRICGREHRPRDPEIRELCKAAGVEWPTPEPRSTDSFKEDLETDDELEEASESEEETNDEHVEGANLNLNLEQHNPFIIF